ncbi:MAG: hypothetical protein QM755_18290 [Luteolibacter sp.]
MRGYKEIHLRSLKLLERRTFMSSFQPLHHASRELFVENIVDVGYAKVALRLLGESRSAPRSSGRVLSIRKRSISRA